MRVWDTSHLLDEVPARKKNQELVYDTSGSHANMARIRSHFKKLQTRLILGLFLGFLLPNILMSAYFHFQFTHSLKQTAVLNLASVVESQKNTIDLYLQERVANLYNLLHSTDFVRNPSPAQMDQALYTLKQFNEAFVDVGLLDDKGVQIGYSGPYSTLIGRDYSKESWYLKLMSGKKNYFISDSYHGFRDVPHFTIATRQFIDSQPYVMRASLDPDKLFMFLRTISYGKEVESALINRDGVYQVADPGHSLFAELGDAIPSITAQSNVEEIEWNDRGFLLAHSWLGEVQWALVTLQPLTVVQSAIYRARLVLTSSLLFICVFLSIVIFITIRRLVNDARRMAEKGHQLQEMLAHASKLASIGELAEGVAHEINNPLAIIMATSGVIRDMLNPEFELDSSPEAILKELTVIDSATDRAKEITRQLQEMGKRRETYTEACDVNKLIEELLERLAKVELKSKNIEIKKRFGEITAKVMAAPDSLRQVFANILINAGDAITDKGVITIRTGMRDGMACVVITDTGKGIPSENLSKIFNPFFTTKGVGRRTGLGLSIAASIVKYLGGTIKVNSISGSGSTFTILLPVRAEIKEGKK
ncbi:histidine kinase [Desulfococcaceae bacterium OttesenSCG-928-F15]|nr:histidine kinase [Desulfococcaceae bacterium OttesenSCG-928-F15]